MTNLLKTSMDNKYELMIIFNAVLFFKENAFNYVKIAFEDSTDKQNKISDAVLYCLLGIYFYFGLIKK
jgi:hypothetical protein